MSSQRSTEEINDLLLANFLAQSANAGKHVLAAPLYKLDTAPKEVKKTLSIDEQFDVLRECFGVRETVQPTKSVEPLAKQESNPSALPRLNPNAPAWIPHSVMQEQEPEPSPFDFALRMRWTKTKDANGKVKRVFTRIN
jgi:hypothetical protein